MTHKLHEGETDIDAELVRRLLRAQFPEFADLSVVPVESTGTVNTIFRIGDDLYVRLPRLGKWATDLEWECHWLPRLAPRLSLAIPEPIATGSPGSGYPFPWGIYRWIEGDTFSIDRIDDEGRAAADLAQFVTALRGIDPSGVRLAGRKPLAQLDTVTRAVIDVLGGVIDTEGARAAWEASRRAPTWQGNPVWIHADLLPANLLIERGRLKAVLDFGGAGVGDPAADVIAAWSVFGRSGRVTFRAALDVDEGTWLRARGFALHQALLIIPYYVDTNPAFASMATRTVEEVLADANA